MIIRATPVVVKRIIRGKETLSRLFFLQNTYEKQVSLTVKDVDKPGWINVDGVYEGAFLSVPGAKPDRPGKQRLIASIDATNPHFPHKNYEGTVTITFTDANGEEVKVELPVIIEEIVEEMPLFLGTFSLDFGTTNSCYAYKHKVPSRGLAFDRAVASPEMPSLIFFENVENQVNPEYRIGTEAAHLMREHSSMVNSYFISVKRLLGEDVRFVVVDRYANLKRWHVEEIAAFIIRSLIQKAQDEMGERITRVVATYPTLFSLDRKEAIRRAFMLALRNLGVQNLTDKSVVMDVDETSAAAFNHVYSRMLQEFGINPALEKREEQLLVFDFGGGTIDICLVDAKITRDSGSKRRIRIQTELKGLSGEAFYGGDNVTLEIFRILKKRLAIKIAQEHKHLLEEPTAQKEQKEEEEGFGFKMEWGTGKKKGAEKDVAKSIFDLGEEEEEKQAVQVVHLEGEGLDQIVNRAELPAWKDAVKTVLDYQNVIEKTIETTKPLLDFVIEKEKADGTYVDERQSKDIAEKIEDAIETLVPTKWARYEGKDEEMMLTARMIFYELWHEADRLKINLSKTRAEKRNVQSTLTRLAKYTGSVPRPSDWGKKEQEESEFVFEEEEEKQEKEEPVLSELTIDPVKFTEIYVSMEEMNTHVEEPIVAAIKKAHTLWKKQHEKLTAESGLIVVGEEETARAKPLKVVLAGNSSNLPIVQEKIREIFNEVSEEDIVIDPKELKTAVAIGACEEYLLRTTFGEEGAISYSATGFLTRVPYSIGFLDRQLELIDPVKFPHGFYTIFERGTEIKIPQNGGDAEDYTHKDVSEDVFLIHEHMEQLVIFADYHDGSPPKYLGFIDFTQPEDRFPNWEPPEHAKEKLVIRFQLLENRELRAINLRTGEIFAFAPHKEKWDERYPFSGFH